MEPAGSTRHPVCVGQRDDFRVSLAQNPKDSEERDSRSQREDSGFACAPIQTVCRNGLPASFLFQASGNQLKPEMVR